MAKKDVKQLARDLQNLVGKKPKIEKDKFKNWGETQILNEVLSVWPESLEEVQSVIRGARSLGLRVRAAGTGHSWTPLFTDEGNVLIHTRNMKRHDGPQIEVIQDPDHPDNRLVTFMANMTTGELMAFQVSHGFSLSANVILRVVQMGGVIAGACHGVGLDTKTVSDQVVRIRIIDSDGTLREYKAEDDPEMMSAIRCNLGFWGYMYDITLKVDPMIIVETENRWMKVKDIFYDQETFRKLIYENWSIEIFWFPFNGIERGEALEAWIEGVIDCGEWDPKEDEVWIRIVNKTESCGEIVSEKTYKHLDIKSYIQTKGFDLVDGYIRKKPHFAPAFLRSQVTTLRKQFEEKIYQHLPYAVHFRDHIEKVPVYDMEWAYVMDDDCRNVCESIQGVIDIVYKEALNGRFPMNLPLEMRFIADSDVLMAPAIAANPKYGGTGHTCYIEVLSVAGTPDWQPFCQKVANLWGTLRGARPHWCKEWDNLEGIDEFIRQSYAEQMPIYLSQLEKSKADPDGMFFNDRLEKIFYPHGHPGRRKKEEYGDVQQSMKKEEEPKPQKREEEPKPQKREEEPKPQKREEDGKKESQPEPKKSSSCLLV